MFEVQALAVQALRKMLDVARIADAKGEGSSERVKAEDEQSEEDEIGRSVGHTTYEDRDGRTKVR